MGAAAAPPSSPLSAFCCSFFCPVRQQQLTITTTTTTTTTTPPHTRQEGRKTERQAGIYHRPYFQHLDGCFLGRVFFFNFAPHPLSVICMSVCARVRVRRARTSSPPASHNPSEGERPTARATSNASVGPTLGIVDHSGGSATDGQREQVGFSLGAKTGGVCREGS